MESQKIDGAFLLRVGGILLPAFHTTAGPEPAFQKILKDGGFEESQIYRLSAYAASHWKTSGQMPDLTLHEDGAVTARNLGITDDLLIRLGYIRIWPVAVSLSEEYVGHNYCTRSWYLDQHFNQLFKALEKRLAECEAPEETKGMARAIVYFLRHCLDTGQYFDTAILDGEENERCDSLEVGVDHDAYCFQLRMSTKELSSKDEYRIDCK